MKTTITRRIIMWTWAVIATLSVFILKNVFEDMRREETELRVDQIWLYCADNQTSSECESYKDAFARGDVAAMRENGDRVLAKVKVLASNVREAAFASGHQ